MPGRARACQGGVPRRAGRLTSWLPLLRRSDSEEMPRRLVGAAKQKRMASNSVDLPAPFSPARSGVGWWSAAFR